MSTNDKKFESKDELEAWLKDRGLDEDDVGAAAEKLFANKYNNEARLWGITIQELAKYAGIVGPVARELSNKLSNYQQQVSQSNESFRGRSLFRFIVSLFNLFDAFKQQQQQNGGKLRCCFCIRVLVFYSCLLYTSPSPRDS